MATTSPLAPRRYEPDPYSPAIVEDLLSGLTEWRNIQDIIRLTFKALADVVKAQGVAIKDLERQTTQKVTKTELLAALGQKANTQELVSSVSSLNVRVDRLEDLEKLVQEKVSRGELQSGLKAKATLDEVQMMVETMVSRRDQELVIQDLQRRTENELREINRKLAIFASKSDLETLGKQLQDKVTLAELEDGLSKKANKDSVATAIHRKANRTDVEAALAQKAELSELQELQILFQQDKSRTEQLSSQLEEKVDRQEITQHILPELSRKLDRGDIEDVHRALRDLKTGVEKRQSDQTLTFDSHIGSLRGEIDHVRVTLTSSLNKKADVKDLDSFLTQLSKKPDGDYITQLISASQDEAAEHFEAISAELKTINAKKEEKSAQMLSRVDNGLVRLEEDMRKTREQLVGVMEDRRKDAEDTGEQMKTLTRTLSSDVQTQLQRLSEEVAILLNEVQDLAKEKTDRKDLQELTNALQVDIREKATTKLVHGETDRLEESISQVSSQLQDLFAEQIKDLEREMNQRLTTKAEVTEVQKIASQSVASTQFSQAMTAVATVEDVEGVKQVLSGLRVDLIKKANQSDLDLHVSFTKTALEEAARDIVLKANIKDVCTLLDMKASKCYSDIDDVNKALLDLQRASEQKLQIEEFRQHLRQQSSLNDMLSTASCVGRWGWRSGELRAGNAVPWEHQTLNTQPDNFLWERDKSNILVVAAGLYEIAFGFFARKKPNAQLLVNGEPVLTATSNTGVVHSTRKGAAVTGLTLIDFLSLPARARLAIAYTGDAEGEGFISLKKLS